MENSNDQDESDPVREETKLDSFSRIYFHLTAKKRNLEKSSR